MFHCKLPMSERIKISIVGAGGNGAQMAAGVAQISTALVARGGLPLHVTIYDDDRVSTANVGRQLFSPADVGRFKADVIVERTNWFYSMDWVSEPVRINQKEGRYSHTDFLKSDIVISAVDTAKSRLDIEQRFTDDSYQRFPTYILDVGNRTRTGQVVLGAIFRKKYQLPTLSLLYPEITDDDFQEQDQGPSCSLAEALQKQDLFVNRDVTTSALHILWDMISKRSIEYHGAFINLETMRRTPLKIDRATWLRMNPDIEQYLTED